MSKDITSILRGWDFDAGNVRQIEDLPLHVYQKAGEGRIKPCAELVFNEEALVATLNKGLMPLVSLRDRDSVAVGRFQSLGEAGPPSGGPWC